MSIHEQIERERESLKALCSRIGVSGLTASIDGSTWDDVTFVGDLGVERIKGYAARFFDLEDGLVRIFHRPVRVLDLEGVKVAAQRNLQSRISTSAESIELLHAS
jgi:hypothetical protein